MDSNDEFYTTLNEDNINRYNFDKKELINYYASEGYISFSCHYKNAYTIMKLKEFVMNNKVISENCFTLNAGLGRDIYIIKDLYDNERSFKIAVLDEHGNIIQTSAPFAITNEKKGYLASEIKYNIAKNDYSFKWSRDDYNNIIKFKITNKLLFVGIIIFLICSISFIGYKWLKRKND